jgi:hypothetical protein
VPLLLSLVLQRTPVIHPCAATNATAPPILRFDTAALIKRQATRALLPELRKFDMAVGGAGCIKSVGRGGCRRVTIEAGRGEDTREEIAADCLQS